MSPPDAHPAYHLAMQVIQAKKRMGDLCDRRYAVSDEAIYLLLRLAYGASLMEEEGRFPKFRMACCGTTPTVVFGQNPPWDSVPLRVADDLRRLAPIADRPNSALAIMTPGNPTDIRCTGIYEFSEIIAADESALHFNPWEMGEVLSPPLLTIRVEGPGRIRAGYLPAHSYLLHGGEVKERMAWHKIPAIAAHFQRAGEAFYARLQEIDHSHIHRILFHPQQCETLITLLWGHILQLTAATRHGGMFVLKVNGDSDHIVDGFQAHFDLATLFTQAVRQALLHAGENLQSFHCAWQARRVALFNIAEQTAGLSAVDGCVVVDQHLNLREFGAKLEYARTLPLPPILSGTGTRHASAYNFCAENAAIALVVSQDGQLTVMVPNGEGPPTIFRNLDTLVH